MADTERSNFIDREFNVSHPASVDDDLFCSGFKFRVADGRQFGAMYAGKTQDEANAQLRAVLDDPKSWAHWPVEDISAMQPEG